MIYRITVLPRARLQLVEQALWWSEHRSAEQASRWLEGFERALATLEKNPQRCAVARENDAFDAVIRELRYGLGVRPTHRAVFEIRGDEVLIFSVRHLAQRDLTPEIID